MARSYPLSVPTLGDLRIDHNAVHDRLRDGALADGGRASGTHETGSKVKSTTNFPPGWDEERVRRLLQHYESMSEDEEAAEDEAALDDSTQTVMQIPQGASAFGSGFAFGACRVVQAIPSVLSDTVTLLTALDQRIPED